MINRFTTGFILTLTLTTASAATAVYSGTLGIPNVGYASYQENISNPNVYAGIALAQQQFMNTIKSSISPPIMSIISGVSGYQAGSGYVSASGPITITLNNGVVSLSGLQVSASLVVSQANYGITATCNVTTSTNPGLTITGTLNPATGILSPTGVQNFSLSTSYSCSNSLDWVPIVNLIADTMINRLVDQQIAQQTRNAYNSLGNIGELAPIHFIGLDQIPNGIFIYNGTDYGAQLKSSLFSIYYSSNVRVTIGDPKYYIIGPKGYPHIAHSTDLVMSLNINGLTLDLLDKRTYVDEVYCPSSAPYCFFF